MHLKKQSYILHLSALLLLFAVTSCGVKPSSVEPPEGKEGSTFPRTYPAAPPTAP